MGVGVPVAWIDNCALRIDDTSIADCKYITFFQLSNAPLYSIWIPYIILVA